jgi:hypothetical protein
MHGPTNVKSSNNISKWQMGFNSAFKGINLPSDTDKDGEDQLFSYKDKAVKAIHQKINTRQ